MPQVRPGRFAAQIEGDFVVFLIGARVNQFWAVQRWFPVTRAMPRMLQELAAQPELGLLHAEFFLSWKTLSVLQYWRSYDQLHEYAHARDKAHLPAWAEFQKRARGNASVGIYHESYLVPQGSYETIYADMPDFGLGRAPARWCLLSAAWRMPRRGCDGSKAAKLKVCRLLKICAA